MWRPRDRERFIGGYDPEHEMPNPDRDRGERWQSDVYRHNSRDTRFAYRFNPDRFEHRYGDRDRGGYDPRWNRDARDASYGNYGGRDRNFGGYGEYSDYDRGYDRNRYDYNRGGYDRGYDYNGGGNPGWNDMGRFSSDRWTGSDYDRAREFGGRGYERDWRDRQQFDRGDRDRGYGSEFNDDDYDRWRNRRW